MFSSREDRKSLSSFAIALLFCLVIITFFPLASEAKKGYPKPKHLFKPSQVEPLSVVSQKPKSPSIFAKEIQKKKESSKSEIVKKITKKENKTNSLWNKESKIIANSDLDNSENKKVTEPIIKHLDEETINIEQDGIAYKQGIIEDQLGDLIDGLGILNFFGHPDAKRGEPVIITEVPEAGIKYVDKPSYEQDGFDFFVPKTKPKMADVLKTDKSLPTILDTDVKSVKRLSFKPRVPKHFKRRLSKRLKMYNLHTNERINVIFWKNGTYINSGLRKINYFLRDFRQKETTSMDIGLINLLHKIVTKLNYNGEVHIISGYRSKKTQKMFRKQGRKVARKSQHSLGKAIDIKLPGISTKKLRDVAKSFKAGGVGYYSKDRFVHIDTGDVRYW